jgi:hypothetical protein
MITQAGLEQLPYAMADGTFVAAPQAAPQAGLESTPLPATTPAGVNPSVSPVMVPGQTPMTMQDRRALAMQMLNEGKTPAEIRAILQQMNAAAADDIDEVAAPPAAVESAGIMDVAAQGLRGALQQATEGIGYGADILGFEGATEAGEEIGQDLFGLTAEEQAAREQRAAEQGTAGYVGDIVTGAVASSTPMLATAATGAGIGGMVAGPFGAGVGALIGAVAGAFPTYVGSGKQRAEENGWDLEDPTTQQTVLTTALGLSVVEGIFGVGGKTVSPIARELAQRALSQTAIRAGTRNAVEESAQEVAVTMAEIAVFDTSIRERLSEGEIEALIPYVRERYGQEITEAFIGGFGAGAVFSGADVYRQAQTNSQRREDVKTLTNAAQLGGVDLSVLEKAAQDPAQVRVLAEGAARIRESEQQVKKAQTVMQAVQQTGDPAKIAEAQANLVAAAAASEAAFNSVIPAMGGLDTTQIKTREAQEDQRAKDFLVAEGVADPANMPPLPGRALRGLRSTLEAAKARVTDAETAANDPGLFDPEDRKKTQAELKLARDELQKVRDTVSLKTGKVTQEGLRVEGERKRYDAAVDWQFDNRFAKADPVTALSDAQKIVAGAAKDPDKGLKVEIGRLQKKLDSATTVEEMTTIQKAIAERQTRMGREAPLVAAARRFITNANPQQAGTAAAQGSSPAAATGLPAQPVATPVAAPPAGAAVPAAPAVTTPAPPTGTGPAGAPASAGVATSTAGLAPAVPPTAAPTAPVAAPSPVTPPVAAAPVPPPVATPVVPAAVTPSPKVVPASIPATDAYTQAKTQYAANKMVTPPEIAAAAAPIAIFEGYRIRQDLGLSPEATTAEVWQAGGDKLHTAVEYDITEAIGLPRDTPLGDIERAYAALAATPAAAPAPAPAAAPAPAPAAKKPAPAPAAKKPAPAPAAKKPAPPAAGAGAPEKPKPPAAAASAKPKVLVAAKPKPKPKAPVAAKPKPKAPAAKPVAPAKPVSLRDKLEEEAARVRPPPVQATAPVVAGEMPKKVPVKVPAAEIAKLAPSKSNGGRGYVDEFPILRQTHVTEAQAIKFLKARAAETGNEHAVAFYADTGEAVQAGTSGKHGSVGSTVALSLAMRADRPLVALHTHPPISSSLPYSSSFSPADFAVTAVAAASRKDPSTHREIVLKADGGLIEFSFTPKGATTFAKVSSKTNMDRLQKVLIDTKYKVQRTYPNLTSAEALYIASEALTRALDKHGLITYKVKVKSKFETFDAFKGAIEYAERQAYADVGARFSLRRPDDGKRGDVADGLGGVLRSDDMGPEGPDADRVEIVDRDGDPADRRGRRVRQSRSASVAGGPYETRLLPGLPERSPGPNQRLVDAAADYVLSMGLPLKRQKQYVAADPERGKRIADAYDAMEHNPSDPDVAAAYQAMADETVAQYRALMSTGMKVEMWKPGMTDPYPAGPMAAVRDMLDNNHLWVFPTEGGFGQTAITAQDRAENPMLAVSEFKDANGRPMLVNDLFRAVHDAFGHGREGVGFGANGEENTWQSHVRMFSPLAAKAMTTETRGQNSWVNFGPLGEHNRANQRDTIYAPQKIGLLPDFVWTEGVEDMEPSEAMMRQGIAEVSGDVQPAFYSPALRGVETAKVDSAPAQDWKSIVKSMPGVKKAEIEWLGVNEWLDAQSGQVTKADLMAYIEANTIDLRVFQQGGKSESESDRDFRVDVHDNDGFEPDWDSEAEIYEDQAREQLQDEAGFDDEGNQIEVDEEAVQSRAYEMAQNNYDWDNAPRSVTVYDAENPDDEYYGTYYPDTGSFEIDGLGSFMSTYEVQEAAEIVSSERERGEQSASGTDIETVASPDFEQYIEPGYHDNYREIIISSPTLHVSGPNRADFPDPYRHPGHFDYPNVLVHARVTERGGADGSTVYFVEEIQSDLSSDIRKQGPAPTPEVIAEYQRLISESHQTKNRIREAKEAAKKLAYRLAAEDPVLSVELGYDPVTDGVDLSKASMLQFGTTNLTNAHDVFSGDDTGLANRILGRLSAIEAGTATYDTWDATLIATRLYRDSPDFAAAVDAVDALDKQVDTDYTKVREFERANPGINNRKTYPQTPFMGEGAYSLAVKRLLRDAAMTNADAFAWTPGAMQAERWNTAAQNVVRRVRWSPYDTEPNENGHRYVNIATQTDDHTVIVDRSGKITYAPVDGWEGETLSRLIGQSLAQRIMTETEGEVGGTNIAFQNSGYAIAYDQQIKRNVEAFAKKFGGKVEESTDVRLGGNNSDKPVWLVRMTPEMKEAALRPMPLFMRDPDAANAPRTTMSDADIEAITADLQADLKDMNLDGAVPVRVVKNLTDLAGDQVFGYAEGGRITVNAGAAPGAKGVMRHEIIHALRDGSRWGQPFGLFTEAEWTALEAAARADEARLAQVRETYAADGLTESQILEEVIAERFRDWASRRDTAADPDGVFGKIMSFLRGLAQALFKSGARAEALVFDNIATGNLGSRIDRGFTLPGAATDITVPEGAALMRSPLADPPPLVDVPEWLDIKTAHGSAIKDTYDLMTDTKRRGRLFERLETNIVNALAPIRNLELQTRGGLGTGMDSAFKSAEIAINDTGRNEMLLHYGAAKLGANGEYAVAAGTIGLMPMLKKLGTGQAVVDWQRYMAARRAQELKARGIELPVDDAAIAEGLALKSPIFDEVAADWKRFNDANVDFLVDTGRITRTTANALKAQAAYIPLYRSDELVSGEVDIFDIADLDRPGAGAAFVGSHLTARNPGIKAIKGGTDHKINNIVENMVRNTRAIVSAGMRNRATNMSVELMKEAGYVDVIPAYRVDPVSGASYPVPAPRGDSIMMWDKGQEYHVSIATPEGAIYMTALMGMKPMQLQGIMRFMAQVGSFFRQSITLSPGFIARNMVRDIVSTAVLTGGQNLGRNNPLTGLKASARTHASRQAFMAQSGMGDFRFGMPEVGSASDATMIELGILPKTIGSRIGKGVDWMEEQGTRVEMSNRLAFYEAQIAKGVRPDEAAYQALTLINYNRRGAGAGVRLLTVLVPFLNARIQGLARLGEDITARRGPDRKKALTRLAISGAILGAAGLTLWAWNNGDEERREKFENEPLYRRLNYHIIYGPGNSKILIPRAFEIGAVFGTLPEIAFEEIQSRMDGTPSETKAALSQIVIGTFGFNPVPQAMLPAMEVIANYDSFRAQPIEGQRVQRVLREDRVDPYTTATATALAQTGMARTLDLSPLELDHLGYGYGGVFYSLLTAATDAVASNLGLLPARPATVLSAIPGAQATFGSMIKDERDDTANRDFERYYQVRQAVENIYNSAKQATERGDIARARRLLEDAPATIDVYRFLNSIERDISEVNTAMRNIRLDDNLTSREKQARLRPLIAQRNLMAGRVMDIIEEAERRQGRPFRSVAA